MSSTSAPTTIATVGIDLGKNSFHLVGLDRRGAVAGLAHDDTPRTKLDKLATMLGQTSTSIEDAARTGQAGRSLRPPCADIWLVRRGLRDRRLKRCEVTARPISLTYRPQDCCAPMK